MEEKRAKFLAWVQSHKKQLIFAGISISVVVGIILGIKNRKSLMNLWALLEERIEKDHNIASTIPVVQNSESCLDTAISTRIYTLPQEEVNVSRHIRTMAVGRHHSAEKAAEAAALGIELLPNQTLVDPYTKYAA